MEPKTRDMRFDVLKGVATLIVVFGHALQYSIKGYENSLIFNVLNLQSKCNTKKK